MPSPNQEEGRGWGKGLHVVYHFPQWQDHSPTHQDYSRPTKYITKCSQADMSTLPFMLVQDALANSQGS